MSGEDGVTDDTWEPQTAELLRQIKVKVRQRRAELVAVGEERRQWRRRREQIHEYLDELSYIGHVEEQPFASQVPVLGPIIVAVRTMWNNVSTRWYVLPMFHPQRVFNQAVVQVLRALMEIDSAIMPEELAAHRERRLFADTQELDLLARRLSELELRLDRIERLAGVEGREPSLASYDQPEGAVECKGLE